MLRGLFVTGTDTNVGKTVAAAALMHRYRGVAPLRYWKPVQTGIEQGGDTATVERLGACEVSEILDRGIRLSRPVSPHLAAQEANMRIDISGIAKAVEPGSENHRWIVEGAGGVLVPLNETELMIDLIAHLSMPVALVARSTLGTINHTLLTLEALRSRSVRIAGVVMVGEKNAENRRAIEEFGRVAVLGEMPHFPHLTTQALRQWAASELDPDNRLAGYLQ